MLSNYNSLLVPSSIVVVPVRRLAHSDRAPETHYIVIPVSVEANFTNVSTLNHSVRSFWVKHAVCPLRHESGAWLKRTDSSIIRKFLDT